MLWSLQSSLWLVARLIAPVLPAAAKYLQAHLGDPAPLAWPAIDETGGWPRVFTQIPPLTLNAPDGALFPRLDDKMKAHIFEQIVPAELAAKPAPESGPATPAAPSAAAKFAAPGPAKAAAPAEPLGPIKIDDFARIELRVGKVLSAAAIPKAKKLLHLSVDLGEPAPRSIVAGVAEAYAPDQLVGKSVIVVANLEPATIRGVASQGMILAAGDAQILGLSALDHDVPPGTRVR